MSIDYILAWTIPIAPLIAACVCAVLSYCGRGKASAHLPAWAGLTMSATASLILLARIPVDHTGTIFGGYSWLDIGRVRIPISLQFDAISLTEIAVVTCVSLLVAIYAKGYMHGDLGYARFFAVFAGFVASMAMLVLANNLLILYAFWECVGLCSYLLIGYWCERPAAAKAATKAFLVNRIADTGFMIGILLLWYVVGTVGSNETNAISRLDFTILFEVASELAEQHPALLSVIAFCILLGAIGKSAQFPLHVWLPDAMEGPTPVSALIHAATMVTAGVYLICRMSPLLIHAPDILVLMGWLGGITALFAAIIAVFQDDLKRVLAYSTVSQLGYMFMCLSCGVNTDLMGAAVAAAMFHIATHACFKALLFLSAGNVMHALHDEIDMRNFSGLRHVLPATHFLFAVGAAALAGVPLLAGFWSKDGILSLLSLMSKGQTHANFFFLLLLVGYTTAFLTAVYITKAYIRTFLGPLKVPAVAATNVHDMPMPMLWPMYTLSVGAVLLGLVLGPTGFLSDYTQNIAFLPSAEIHSHPLSVPLISTAMCLMGIAMAWFTTRKSLAQKSKVRNLGFLSSLARNRFFIDELYALTIVQPLQWIAKLIADFDLLVVDRAIRWVAGIPSHFGQAFRRIQTGFISSYASWMTMGAIAYLAMILWGSR